MHQVFAAIRIWQLEHKQKLPRHAKRVAERIFGLSRWRTACNASDSEDERERLQQLCFSILHTSGYADEDGDNIRTLSNMEMAIIAYVDEQLSVMDNWPIWVSSRSDPTAPVGIEQVFDAVLTYSDGRTIRYIGTLDGLCFDTHRERYTLQENKTASRLDEAWIQSFEMSHQVTGYLACATSVFGFEIWHSRVIGLKLKPTYKGEDYYAKQVSRDATAILHWGAWVRHTVDIFETYEMDFENAPRYTHSCNRYFRPCSLIPFCADTPDGRIEQFAEMVAVEGSPSERAVKET